jgi:hypothetical protein
MIKANFLWPVEDPSSDSILHLSSYNDADLVVLFMGIYFLPWKKHIIIPHYGTSHLQEPLHVFTSGSSFEMYITLL